MSVSRPLRIISLTLVNYGFWLMMYLLSWHKQIPESLIKPTFAFTQLFAWPVGLLCCSLQFLVQAQLHTMGWRLAMTTSVMALNGILWAMIIDWLLQGDIRTRWRQLSGDDQW